MPDVVISDLGMPSMGGIELCVRLHELDADLPVIVLTAMEHAEAGLACLQAGAENYLSKPVQLAGC